MHCLGWCFPEFGPQILILYLLGEFPMQLEVGGVGGYLLLSNLLSFIQFSIS